MPTVKMTVARIDARLRGESARGFEFEPKIRQAGVAAAERGGAAHPPIGAAPACLDRRIVAQPCLQRRHLLVDRAMIDKAALTSLATLILMPASDGARAETSDRPQDWA